MFGKDAMIKLGVSKLKDFMRERGNVNEIEFTENEINDWFASTGQSFSILTLQDPKKGKVIKVLYSGE